MSVWWPSRRVVTAEDAAQEDAAQEDAAQTAKVCSVVY